jgi:hypothetical protein
MPRPVSTAFEQVERDRHAVCVHVTDGPGRDGTFADYLNAVGPGGPAARRAGGDCATMKVVSRLRLSHDECRRSRRRRIVGVWCR